MNYRCYQNNTAVKHFYINRGRCEELIGYSLLGALTWWGPGEYVTLDKKFYDRLFEKKIAAAPITSIFSSLSHYLRRI